MFECSLDDNGRLTWSINIRLIVSVIYCVQSFVAWENGVNNAQRKKVMQSVVVLK